jgi:glycosyltransferase 2 family protein
MDEPRAEDYTRGSTAEFKDLPVKEERPQNIENEVDSPPHRPRVLKALLRTAVGVALIVFLAWRSDVQSIFRALGAADRLLILIANALMLLLIVVSAFRWGIFLKRLNVPLPAGTTLRLTFVGSFFNSFLPTGIGGDAYKAIKVKDAPTSMATSFASVVLDRFSGIFALATIGVVVTMFQLLDGDQSPLVVAALAVAAAILVGTTMLILFGDRLLGRGSASWFGARPRLRRMFAAISVVATDRRSVGLGLMFAGVAQILGIGAHLALARSVGIDVPVTVLTAALLVATIAATLPVTINGLGVREAVWVWSLGLYEVQETEAFAYALLVLVMSLTSSAVGGIVYAVVGGTVDGKANTKDMKESQAVGTLSEPGQSQHHELDRGTDPDG